MMKLHKCYHRIKSTPAIFRVALAGVACALLLNLVFFQVSLVRGNSMEPLINENSIVLGTRYSYWFSTPRQGDIIVFQKRSVIGENLIKMVVGIPGDTIEIADNTLFCNGVALFRDAGINDTMSVTVPENSYFVVGVNFAHSNDSRKWPDPFVTKDEIKSRVLWKGKNILELNH